MNNNSDKEAQNVVLIDNYDSFTFNIAQYYQKLGVDLTVYRNDETTVSDIIKLNPDLIVISPGPSTPDNAGICLELIKSSIESKTPVLGVCLGHQCIAQVFGGKITRCQPPIHGKVSQINHSGMGVLKGLPSPFTATRYHSLIVDKESCPDELEITATTDDGIIMGIKHKSLPIEGLQFHPESILSEHGLEMLRNSLIRDKN